MPAINRPNASRCVTSHGRRPRPARPASAAATGLRRDWSAPAPRRARAAGPRPALRSRRSGARCRAAVRREDEQPAWRRRLREKRGDSSQRAHGQRTVLCLTGGLQTGHGHHFRPASSSATATFCAPELRARGGVVFVVTRLRVDLRRVRMRAPALRPRQPACGVSLRRTASDRFTTFTLDPALATSGQPGWWNSLSPGIDTTRSLAPCARSATDEPLATARGNENRHNG